MRSVALALCALTLLCCHQIPAGDFIAVGTWGGDDAGAIVTDTLMHVHVGCTYGDVKGRVPLDEGGNFSADGSYLLRAFPIAVGPTMPAKFTGRVSDGKMTLTVVVTDTIEHTTVTKGPVKLTFGKEPSMGPCPICRNPGDRKKH